MSKKSKTAIAILLGVGSFILSFVLGEITLPSTVKYRESMEGVMVCAGVGLYCLAAQYALSRGNPRAVRSDWWLILSLNGILILTTLVAAFVEQNKDAVLKTAVVTALAVLRSYAGAAVAAHEARRRQAVAPPSPPLPIR